MKEISEKLVKEADSIEDLATKICGYGYYAHHNDDSDHPIPKDAVREYLEMGAALNRRQMMKCAVDGCIVSSTAMVSPEAHLKAMSASLDGSAYCCGDMVKLIIIKGE